MFKIITVLLTLTASTLFAGEPDKVLHEKCLYPSVMVINTNPTQAGSGVIIKSVKNNEKYDNYVFSCAHLLAPIPKQIPKPEPQTKQNTSEPDISEIIIDLNLPPPPMLPEDEDKYEVVVRVGIYEDWSNLVNFKDHIAEILFMDKEQDLLLLKFQSDKQLAVADVDKEPKLYIGNDVFRFGFGLKEAARMDCGKVTGLNKAIGTTMRGTYRVSIPTIMGDSGGGVFHENKLIGLAQAIRSIPHMAFPHPVNVPVYHMTYVIPIQRFYASKEIVKALED